MDLEDVRTFLKVAELGSFSRAGEQLGSSKSRASLRVRALEAELGARLFSRTTRAVRLTPDGEQFLGRAHRLLLDADELAAMFQAPSNLRGRVRVDLPVNFARDVLIPRLPEFLAAHPQLELVLSTTDRRVDVIREGFDCVLRVGALDDSGLTVQRLGFLPEVNCASPAYLLKYGTPRTLAELASHFVVHYSPALGGDTPSFEYWDGQRYRLQPMRSLISVNNVDAYSAACVAGLGIIQAPRYGTRQKIAAGTLVEILPELKSQPMPVSILHAHRSQLPKRVRVVTSWIAEQLRPLLDKVQVSPL